MPQIRLISDRCDVTCLDITDEEASLAAAVLGGALDGAMHGVRVLGRYTREIIDTLSTDTACQRVHAFFELQHRLVEASDDHSAEWRIAGLQS